MSQHVFGAFVTGMGTAANNRGETDGNTSTLQKLVWNGQVHTTVSAESIRFALRRRFEEAGEDLNRRYDEVSRTNKWQDHDFKAWRDTAAPVSIDDDLLGYMSAEAAKDDETKGTAKVRRAVLEVTRAVSLTPWPGDVTFNAASPGATPSAAKKDTSIKNPVPYVTEMHATRYQYGIAMTPARLRDATRAGKALDHLCALGTVAGNHGRFLFDFSPESLVLRITDDPAPRLLYGFNLVDGGGVGLSEIVRKVKARDILASELFIGGAVADGLSGAEKAVLEGAVVVHGVKEACAKACSRLSQGSA